MAAKICGYLVKTKKHFDGWDHELEAFICVDDYGGTPLHSAGGSTWDEGITIVG